MSIWQSFKEMFSPGAEAGRVRGESGGFATQMPAPSATPAVTLTASQPVSPESAHPVPSAPFMRRKVQAPVLSDPGMPPEASEILIKGQPTPAGDQCVFRVNRPLFRDFSWYFPNFESAEGSALAEAVFSVDGVETVLVHDSAVVVTRKHKGPGDWKPLAGEVGAAIRSSLQSGRPLIAERIVSGMPTEEKIRDDIQRVIDLEINPGVAGHGGRITLRGVRGNAVTIQMGGGCQGCSSADVTLKMGIHGAFRRAVPFIGAIYDETDHTAGLNPYFS